MFYQGNRKLPDFKIPTQHMKQLFAFLLVVTIIFSCNQNGSEVKTTTSTETKPMNALIGTWKLLEATLIEKGDTTVTDYTQHSSFIKIINETHFAFLHHDLSKGKEASPVFTAGGGQYTLKDSLYTEHLGYCSDRQWEGNDFSFTVTIKNDTLIQYGVEKVESAGVNRVNMEKYVRVRN
jgi:hypothetical protein